MELLVHVYNAQCNNYNAFYKINTRRNLREHVQNGVSIMQPHGSQSTPVVITVVQ